MAAYVVLYLHAERSTHTMLIFSSLNYGEEDYAAPIQAGLAIVFKNKARQTRNLSRAPTKNDGERRTDLASALLQEIVVDDVVLQVSQHVLAVLRAHPRKSCLVTFISFA